MVSMADRSEVLDALVIGGSQAGLAMGYHLSRLGLKFVILDAGSEVGETWRSRWDSLVLFTSAQFSGLPGIPFPAGRDTYPTKDQVADYLQRYAAEFDLPIQLESNVTSLVRDNGGYVARAGAVEYRTQQVIVATGPFQEPLIPAVASEFGADVFQIHSLHYRRPEQLPQGRTLVVGGGNSGYQIAEELAASRPVELAIGTKAPMFPQRILGRDLFWWLGKLRIYGIPGESRFGRRLRAKPDPVIGSSKRRIRKLGVTFRPRLTGADGRTAGFADGSTGDFDAVVWATGFRSDHSWVEVPEVFDAAAGLVHSRGVTEAPGLYFLGLSWLHTRGSALLGWVKDDALFLAQRIAERAEATERMSAEHLS